MRERSRKHVWVVAAVSVALVLAVFLVGFYLYVRGGGPAPSWVPFRPAIQDPLAESRPAEQVLRSMRLAGFERAVAGDEDGMALVRLDIPVVNSPADVEIAWQAGVASLAQAYPEADRYVVQLFAPGQAILEIRWSGSEARSAVDGDDSGALRSSAEFVHLSGEVAGE